MIPAAILARYGLPALVGAALLGAVWWWHSSAVDAAYVAGQRAEQATQAARDKGASLDAARRRAERQADLSDIAALIRQDIAGIRIQNTTITKGVEREIQTRVEYRDCVLPDDGLVLLNAARAGLHRARGADDPGRTPAGVPAAAGAGGAAVDGRPAP